MHQKILGLKSPGCLRPCFLVPLEQSLSPLVMSCWIHQIHDLKVHFSLLKYQEFRSMKFQ